MFLGRGFLYRVCSVGGYRGVSGFVDLALRLSWRFLLTHGERESLFESVLVDGQARRGGGLALAPDEEKKTHRTSQHAPVRPCVHRSSADLNSSEMN